MPKTKRPWKVWVEVAVDVDAFDAASAQHKAERAFTEKRQIAPDVVLHGQAIVYDAEQVAVA